MSIKINENVDLKDGNSVAAGLHLCFSGIYVFRDNRGKIPNAIGSVDKSTKKIVLLGVDLTDKIKNGSIITIKESTGNDGEYTVSSCTFGTSNTTIVVNETISDSTNDGSIGYDNFEYVLEVGVIGFSDEIFCNKNVANPSFSLKLDASGEKPILSNYKWDLTHSEYFTGQFNDIASNKLKESLENSGYASENIIVI